MFDLICDSEMSSPCPRSHLQASPLVFCFSVLFLTFLLPCRLVGQEARWEELNNRAKSLYGQGKYEEAIAMARETLRVAEITFSSNDIRVAASLNNLANLLRQQQQYEEAKPLYERALIIQVNALGRDHPDVARTLNDVGSLYDDQGNYSEAERLFKLASAIREMALPPDHPDVATSLNNLAYVYEEEGRYGEAVPLYKRSLAIQEKALGPEHLDMAIVASNLAFVYDKQGNYTEAEPLFDRALTIREKVLGPNDPAVATSLHELASLYLDQGRYAEAERLCKRALSIREKVLGLNDPAVAGSLTQLGSLYHAQSRYVEAEPLFEQALSIQRKTLGPEHRDVAFSLGNLALLYQAQGRYAEAEPLYEQALTILEKALGAEHPGVALILSGLASLYQAQGRYAEAEPLYEQALTIRRKALGPDAPEVATTLTSLGFVYQAQGRYAEAESPYTQALRIRMNALHPNDADIATSLSNLADSYHGQRRYHDAENYYGLSLTRAEQALGADHLFVATILNNLAALFNEQDRYAEAEPLYRRSLAIREKALGPEHVDVANSLNNLAGVYRKQGRYAEAEPLYRRSLTISEKALGPEHPYTGLALGNLALSYYGWRRPLDAQTYFDRSFTNLTRQLEHQLPYESENDRLTFFRAASNVLPVYFSFVSTYRDEVPALPGKVYDLLLWEKGMVAASVAGQRAQVTASGDAEALKLLDQLSAKRNQYAALARSHSASRKDLDQLSEEANVLEKQLARSSTTFAEQEKLVLPSWREVQKSLKAEEAAVEFVRFPFNNGKQWTVKSYYVALVLRPNATMPQWVPLGEAKDLEGARMNDYRQRVAMGPPSRDDVGVRFYRAFWKPLQPNLIGTTRVYVSPDGLLNNVSWAAVPMEDGRLLIEKYDVHVVLSTRDLLRPTPSTSTRSAVLVGNPKFDLSESDQRAALEAIRKKRGSLTSLTSLEKQPPSVNQTKANESRTAIANVGRGLRSRDEEKGPLEPLEKTQKELESVGGLLEKQQWHVESYSQQDALEEVIKAVKGPRLLHVATHGFFEPDQEQKHREMMSDRPSGLEDPMLRSGLYFAGADRARAGRAPVADLEDGELTAYEATGLNLQGTELVVLSACKTGLGEVQNGEGVFGLRRALQEAGAEAVLMSMWSVPDKETQELMTLFYDNWLGGKDKQEALYKAQLQLRSEVKARRGDDRPYYWAAFVLVGR